MRRIIYVVICTVLLAVSCKDDDMSYPIQIYEPGPMTYGYAEMTKNGISMKATVAAENAKFLIGENLFTINFFTFNEFGFFKENIGFGAFPYEEGEYVFPFNEFSAIELQGYSVISDDSELAEDGYDMDSTYRNVVIIDELDTVANILKGTFDVRFIIEQPKTNPVNPDVVTFSNGRFDAQFQN